MRPPQGSEPGYRRPVVIVQSNDFNRSRISTVIVAVITTNLKLAEAFNRRSRSTERTFYVLLSVC
jgi:mRNA interferase MazF